MIELGAITLSGFSFVEFHIIKYSHISNTHITDYSIPAFKILPLISYQVFTNINFFVKMLKITK